MILVQNLLQQLNGNRMWNKKIYFLILFFAYGNIFSQNFYTQTIKKNQSIDLFCLDNSITLFDFSALNPKFNQQLLNIGDEIITIKNQDNFINENDFIFHKVKRKQTLEKISNLYNVNIDVLRKYNNLTSFKLIKGSIIKIPSESIVSQNNEKPNKVKYYEVLAKEGKWRVAYKYGITIDQLELINPNIGEFLKISEKILVPNIDFKKVNRIDENYAYYKVLAKEGFYRLKLKLDVEENTIVYLNPFLSDTELQEGMILKLPKKIAFDENLVNDQKFNLSNSITNYTKKKIALMLPFGIDDMNFDSIQIMKSQLTNDKLLNLSLDFYVGVSTAIDSIASYGIPIEMEVFDTKSSSKSDIYEIIKRNNLSDYDLLIGPLTSDAFNYTSDLLENESVQLISPLSKVIPKKNVVNTITNNDILFERIVSFVESDTTTHKKYIISDSQSIISSDKLKERFQNATRFYSTINDSGVDTNSLVLDDLDSTFIDKKNIVFLETRDQGFVSNVTSILNSFVNDSVQISLYTTSSSKAFLGNNISNYYLSNLNFHYPSINKPLDYNFYSDFINNFKNKYNFLPNKYVVRAYDLVLDLLLRLSSIDAKFEQDDMQQTEHIENRFKYLKNKDSLGYRNIASFIIKYENLELIVVD
ncbi:MAG: LysM peptidoglycan-binding domain-containing protein [Flavobacteriaceae bacterium]|nr:LysM peptidoglycan-binding domain-containing protein [Flavobacteriaceae bacterium]